MRKSLIQEIVNLKLSNEPHIHVRSVLFDDNKAEIKNKNKKQFITCTPSTLMIIFEDGSEFSIFADKGYIFDGATIPFNIGKGDMRLLIPALFHDILCDNKALVDYNRKLASLIFKEALIYCGVSKVKADFMYRAVEAYQIVCGNWRKPKDG